MRSRAPIQLVFGKTGSDTTDKNFTELERVFAEGCAIIGGAETDDVALVVGDNSITVPGRVKTPRMRITSYIDAASTLFDKGMVTGKWVVNSSAACTARFIFA